MGKRATRDVPAKKDFTRWYPYIVEAADLVDKRYPIKGMDVWRPIWTQDDAIDRRPDPQGDGADRA